MAEIYNRTLVETKAAMSLIPQSARVLAKNNAEEQDFDAGDRKLAFACRSPMRRGSNCFQQDANCRVAFETEGRILTVAVERYTEIRWRRLAQSGKRRLLLPF